MYEAHDRHLDARVAVKLLNPSDAGANDPWREAQLLQKLSSRYLLRVLNADVVIQSDLRFIVTPVLSGGDLESSVRPYGVPPSAAAHYIQQVASGLDRIHRADMVHRDVKPGNVFIEGDAVVLGDLGFCHMLVDGKAPSNGSFCTVAPEVLREDGACTPVSDVYSLAATAFYLMSGEYPVDHRIDRAEQKLLILAGSIRELRTVAPHISRSVGAVVRKSLNTDPTKRHANATEFGTALAGAVHGYRDWHRVSHEGHIHCLAGARHGQKKGVQVCCSQSDARSIEVTARIAETGRRVSGTADAHVTPRQLVKTLQKLTAEL